MASGRSFGGEGYAPLSGRNLLRVAAHFSRWLDDRRLGLGDLAEERVASFLAHRRRQGYTQFLSPRALGPLLGYLRGIGVVVRARRRSRNSDRSAAARVRRVPRARALPGRLDDPRLHGLRPGIRYGSLRHREPEMGSAHPGGHRGLRDAGVSPVEHRMLQAQGHGAAVALALPSRPRRYLAQSCWTACRRWPAGAWRGCQERSSRIRSSACSSSGDERSTVGLRDAAIVRLMVRLGLRAGEVAALELDDLDWRAGEIVVRGKGARQSRLPLPHDVGRAARRIPAVSADRARPARKVFLRSRAPYRGLEPGGVIARRQDAPCDVQASLPVAHTCCATPPPRRCCARGRRSPRSRTCSGTATSTPRRSTPRSISRRCARWPSPGREVSHEAPRSPPLTDYLALRRALGFKLYHETWWLPDFVAFSTSHGSSTITDGAGAALGPAAGRRVTPSWWAHAARSRSRGSPATTTPAIRAPRSRRRTCSPTAARRQTPHIYTDEEIAALAACRRAV